MDDRSFDTLARKLAQPASRRGAMKTLAALGAVAAGVAVRGDASAARRGFAGPRFRLCAPGMDFTGDGCVCQVDRQACFSGDTGNLVSCCQVGAACCFDGSCVPPDQFCAF